MIWIYTAKLKKGNVAKLIMKKLNKLVLKIFLKLINKIKKIKKGIK